MNKVKHYWLKIIRLTVPIYLVGFGAFGCFTLAIIDRYIAKHTYLELTSLASEKSMQLEYFFQNAINDILVLSQNDEIEQLASELADTSRTLNANDFPGKLAVTNLLKAKGCYSKFTICLNSCEVSFSGTPDNTLSVTYRNLSTAKNNNNAKINSTPKISLSYGKDSSIIESAHIIVPIISTNSVVLCKLEITSNTLKSLINCQHRFKDGTTVTISSTKKVKSISNVKNDSLFATHPVKLTDANLLLTVKKDLSGEHALLTKIAIQITLTGFAILVVLVLLNIYMVKRAAKPLESLKLTIKNSETGQYEPIRTFSSQDEVGWLGNAYHRLIMQLKHTSKQLDEREERLNQFYLATADGIYIHQAGTPMIFNPALQKLSGYTELDLRKLRLYDFLMVDESVLLAAREQKFASFEAELKTKQGKRLHVEVQLNQINLRGQMAESLVIRDITRRRSVEKELQQERKRQVKSVIDGQEKERQRLSRELHDGLGQNLVAIKLKLESISAKQAGELSGTLTQVKQMFNHTIEEVRRISNNLMPAALKEFSLAVVLRNLCTEIESNSGINVGLTIGVLPESLDQVLKTYIYRIVQEALTNVVKHSGASRAVVSVFSDFSNLHLQIEDNGSGFSPAALPDSGNGLYNMKERAILLGGKINIISAKGKGVKIVAEFPLNQPKSEQYE